MGYDTIIHNLKKIRLIIEKLATRYGFCPRCGRPWPAELERYTLDCDEGELLVFCSRCGHEEARHE